MINTLIFDFGNVFINLDIEGNLALALEKFKIETFSEEMLAFNSFYEQGLISTQEFIDFYSENFPNLSREELVTIWNYMLKDFPKHRLEFLQQIKKEGNYNLILLSNTNELHIDWVKEHVTFFDEFKACFNQFYLSHEIQLRKPNQDIFEFVLKENNLNVNQCVFIDDNADNCKTAETLGIKTWNINPKTEDITNLFKTNLF
ncbi:HAD family hydrolase [Aestuariibaculum sediminum]|uniref:HAD family phosphatase n=1 Tax=Aestuariibaculum sediminum TaxID=2770637 RepID=A0A8J6Q9M6_9FLAO|nr:HAD family phosphatase [Aestuariibaculum sediminum]MBD0832617.1 HAD family phosphatase [Aestuariibaculum sediminum]